MKTIQFNNEKYDVEVKLSRLSDEGEFVNDVELVMDNVSELQIVNDLTQPLLRAILFLKDPTSHVSPKYALDGRSFLNIKIYYKTNQKNKNKRQDLLKFEHNFIINDIQIVEKNPDSGIYRYLAVSELVIPWLNKVYYSTYETETQATKIIKDIFQNSALKERFKYYNSSNKEFIHTPVKFNYITPVNYSLQECIFPLLVSSHNSETGIYSIAYNMLNDELRLLSITDEFKNNVIKVFNGIKLPSKFAFSETEAMPKNEAMFNFIRSINTYDRTSTTTLNNFDHINRKWSKDIYDQKRLNNFLPKTGKDVEGDFVSIFKSPSERYKSVLFNSEEVSNISFNVKQRIEEFYKFAQILQFTYTGFLERDVGDLFKVQAHKKDTYNNRESGTWMITRIHHVFSNDLYEQNITLIRSDKRKELFKEEA